jgi:4'-phosphopantetheinyl transferase
VLSDEEKKEARRFQQTKDRRQFVIARALLRMALSTHFQLPSGVWRFERDSYNKPFIAGPNVSQPQTRFSLSHTKGLIACLITLSNEAGVDVEKNEYNQDLHLVARQILSPEELGTLNNLSEEAWTKLFFDYWTLKEAYVKARGLGLDLKLSDISFGPGLDNAIRARFGPSLGDDHSAWVFWCQRLPSKHTISIAARHDFLCELRIISHSVSMDCAGETVTHNEQLSYVAWPRV